MSPEGERTAALEEEEDKDAKTDIGKVLFNHLKNHFKNLSNPKQENQARRRRALMW